MGWSSWGGGGYGAGGMSDAAGNINGKAWAGSYSAPSQPADPNAAKRAAVAREFQAQQDAAQAWNRNLFNEGRGYQQQASNVAAGAYDSLNSQAQRLFDPQNQKAFEFDESKLGVGVNKWGAGGITKDSPLYSPQAAAAQALNARSGLGGTTAGANSVVLGNSKDLFDMRNQEYNNQLNAYTASGNRMASLTGAGVSALNSGAGMYTGQLNNQAGFLERGSATGPDLGQLERLAGIDGQGNTQGMYAPSIGGGGGFSSASPASFGYQVPTASWGLGGGFYGGGQQQRGRTLQQQGKQAQAFFNNQNKGRNGWF